MNENQKVAAKIAKRLCIFLLGAAALTQTQPAFGQKGGAPTATVQLFEFASKKAVSEVEVLTVKKAERTCRSRTQFTFVGAARVQGQPMSFEGGTLTTNCATRFAVVAHYSIPGRGGPRKLFLQGELVPDDVNDPNTRYGGLLIEQTGNVKVPPIFYAEVRNVKVVGK